VAVERREAPLDVEVSITFDDHALAVDRASAAIADSGDRPAHDFAVGGA
jgi:hypothetical protein